MKNTKIETVVRDASWKSAFSEILLHDDCKVALVFESEPGRTKLNIISSEKDSSN